MNILEVAKFEPHVALDGGADGLDLIRTLLSQAPARLRRPGLMLLEHGADQGAAVTALARAAFPHDEVTLLQDDAGLDRVVRIITK
jgi:release factor glutamine methyltransferase